MGSVFGPPCIMWSGCQFNKQILVWAGPSPIFSGAKKRTFYNSANGNFGFVFLILRNLLIEIGEIVGICVLRVTLPNARLVLEGPSQFYMVGQKLQFWAKCSTRFSNGCLLFHNWVEYGKSKTKGFIVDYLTTFIPYGEGRLYIHGQTLVQIQVGRPSLGRPKMILVQ